MFRQQVGQIRTSSRVLAWVRRSAALVFLGLMLLFAQPDGHASAQGSLKFFKNYFGSIDYAVGGVGLRGAGDTSGYATGIIHMAGVPADADILDRKSTRLNSSHLGIS